jgi:prepilin-type N-terminal cleavage/methylation domain-containing protein/prepilin-type processing-associated H-X9-DG protein
MKRKNGFTLIELLVVIAIIAILAAILFPVLALDAAGNISYDTSNTNNTVLYSVSQTKAKALFDLQSSIPFGSSAYSHIVYMNSGRHTGKSNVFLFLDGHAKVIPVLQTLNPNRFLWGTRAYNQGGSIILNPLTGNPVE